jgi:hypothetical protein
MSTHPAAAQLLDDAVMRDGLTDKLGRSGHLHEMVGRAETKVNAMATRLLQPRVLGFGLLQDWDVGAEDFRSASGFGLLRKHNVRIEMSAQDSQTLSIL